MWGVFSSFILRQRYVIIFIVAILTVFLGYHARKVKMSYELAQVLPETDSTMIAFQNFQDLFGQDGSVMVIGVKDSSLFQLQNFNAWLDLSEELKAVPGIDEVVSIGSIFSLEKNSLKKTLIPKEVISKKPESQKEVNQLLEQIFRLPFYEGFIYSKDRKSTLMALTLDREFLDSKDRGVLMDEIESKINLFESQSGIAVHSSGLPYIRANNTSKVSKEIKLFILLAILVTSAILLLFFRSFKAMFFSMLVVIVGVVWSTGIQVLLDYKITILTGLMPPLIIVIGIPNCIFILNKYHREYKRHGNQILALKRVIQKTGNAIFLTNTTTALGFGTFIFTDSTILVQFGLVATFGILSVFFVSITLLPTVLSFQKPPKSRHVKHLERQWVDHVVRQLIHIVTRHRKAVFISSSLVLILSVYGMSLMKTTGNIADDLPREDQVYKDLTFFEKNFKGVLPFEVMIKTDKKGKASRISTLKKIDQLQNVLSEYDEFSKPLSIVEGIKFARQSYYGGNPEKYALYTNREKSFIGPYLISSKDQNSNNLLKSYLDSNRQITRLTAQMADVGSQRMEVILNELRSRVDSIFPEDRYRVEFTGTSVVWLKGTGYLVKNLILSLSLAIFLIAIIMAVLFSSLRMVFVSLIPNLLPLLVTAGIMGYFGISIKPSTILIFSIAFGISVDDTIHFLAKYKQELSHHHLNLKDASIEALKETGVSMIYTSIVLFFGFGVFTVSDFGGTVALGLLVSITLLFAMASNLILLPSLLLSLDKLLTTKAFEQESLLELIDEEDDIELDELTVYKAVSKESSSSKKNIESTP